MTPEELAGVLGQPERLRVLAAVELGAGGLSEIVRVTGLDARVAGRALRKLEAAGLVEGGAVRHDAFKQAARAAAPAAAVEDHGYGDRRIEGVLRSFVRDGTVVGMPAHRGKRRTVLEHLAQSFEPGTRYTEKEVAVVLRAWCEGGGVDHVTVRRHLVDEELLTREDGTYWRSGGWIDLDRT